MAYSHEIVSVTFTYIKSCCFNTIFKLINNYYLNKITVLYCRFWQSIITNVSSPGPFLTDSSILIIRVAVLSYGLRLISILGRLSLQLRSQEFRLEADINFLSLGNPDPFLRGPRTEVRVGPYSSNTVLAQVSFIPEVPFRTASV